MLPQEREDAGDGTGRIKDGFDAQFREFLHILAGNDTRKARILLRNPCPLNDPMQEWRSTGLRELLADTAGDVGQHSLPSHGMFLAARRAGEIQRGDGFGSHGMPTTAPLDCGVRPDPRQVLASTI